MIAERAVGSETSSRISGLGLRPAQPEDMRRVFDWRNLPEIIEVATVKHPMVWADHAKWFSDSLRGDRRRLWIITVEGEPTGQLRFDFVSEFEREVSVYLVAGFIGRGFGAAAIRMGCDEIWSKNPAVRLTAWIRTENERSFRAFYRAGFFTDLVSSQKNEHVRVTRLPVRDVPHVRLTHGIEEEEAVAGVVRSGQWTGGALVAEVESDFARAAGVKHAVLVGSGIGALRLSLLALGVVSGTLVAVPAYGCAALANAVLCCGGIPVPVDVEESTWNMSPSALRRAKASAPDLNIAIAVHTFGVPARINELRACGVRVIEDCSHAFGRGSLGSLGDISLLSLYATKLVGAGEGGVILTPDENMASLLRKARNYTDQPAAAWRLNDKITGCAAALAQCQLRRLPDLLLRRDEIAGRYTTTLAALSAFMKLPVTSRERVWYRYAVRVQDADRVVAALKALGVEAARPNEPWCDAKAAGAPVAAAAFHELVSLPLYPTLGASEQEHVMLAMSAAMQDSGVDFNP